MRIDGVPGVPQPMDDKGKRPFKVEKYSGEVFIHTRGKRVDFETFISAVSNSMKTGDVRREDRVRELKELVDSGKYSVNTEKLARKMIDAMGGKVL